MDVAVLDWIDADHVVLMSPIGTKVCLRLTLVGRQALEIEFLKGALRNAPRPRNATTSVVTGPMASPSPKDAV